MPRRKPLFKVPTPEELRERMQARKSVIQRLEAAAALPENVTVVEEVRDPEPAAPVQEGDKPDTVASSPLDEWIRPTDISPDVLKACHLVLSDPNQRKAIFGAKASPESQRMLLTSWLDHNNRNLILDMAELVYAKDAKGDYLLDAGDRMKWMYELSQIIVPKLKPMEAVGSGAIQQEMTIHIKQFGDPSE